MNSRNLAALRCSVIGLASLLSGIAPPASAQTPKQIQAALDAAYVSYKDIKEGANADYIPALAKVDPNIYGIALVTSGGKVYTSGDVKSEVSIQSISKVFTMAKVMEEQGTDAIMQRIGAEATGMRFNSIVSIELAQKVRGGPELNPLVNPGAITATSMIQGKTRDEVWDKIVSFHSDFAGRPLTIDKEVYDSEAATNQRNQAIGALMYAYGFIKDNPTQAVDIYTEQCSISVNARDLAVMAATLANAGKNPVSGKQVMKPENVPRCSPSWRLPVSTMTPASGCIARVCLRRAGSGEASSPCRPASSASRWCHRRSMMRATACAHRRRSPISRMRSAATHTSRRSAKPDRSPAARRIASRLAPRPAP